MGYRSDTALAITNAGYNQLMNNMSAPDFQKVKELFTLAQRLTNEEGVLFVWQSIKWYGSDVDFLLKKISELPSEEFIFLEIGEEFEDISFTGSWWSNSFDLCVERKLSYSV